MKNRCRCFRSVIRYLSFLFNRLNLWSISHTDSSSFCLISIISFMYWSFELNFWNSLINSFLMSVSVLFIHGELLVSRLMYRSSAWSLRVIASCVSLVSSSMICFSSLIFSQMNKCFLGSSVASPWNSGNQIVGSCPSILNTELLLPPCGVDTWLVLPELAPLVVYPCVDVLPTVRLHLNFGFLNSGVLFRVIVAHGFMGSTLTLIWIGWLPSSPILGPLIFLSYVERRISSIFSIARRSSTSS